MGYQWILDVEQILANYPRASEAEKPLSQQMAAKLDTYLLQLTGQSDLQGEVAAWRDHFVSAMRRFWPGLFHCYDRPLVPRTNNDLEVFYNGMKQQRRRNTGRKGTQDYLLRYGPYLAFDQGESEATILNRFQSVDQANLRSQRLAMQHRSERRQIMWRFRHRRDDFCADIKRRWDQFVVGPAP
jgi:hypothetical protein